MDDLLYLKYTLIPNLLVFNILHNYYNKIDNNYSFKDYYNNVMKYINVYNVGYEDVYKIVFNTLVNKYSLLIVNVDKLELMNIKK